MSYGFRVSGVLTLKDLTVTGATYGAFKVTRSDYGSKGELYLETVRVTGNRSSDGAAGIWLQSGTTLVARDSTIAHNVSGPTTSAGGAALEIAERSVSQGPASATLYNTTVANNSASGEKDRGAEVSGGGNGGGIRNKGNLTLDGSSRVTGNTSRASESGKGGEGGGIYNTGTLTIKGGSSVTGNTAQPYKTGSRSGQVGGIFNSGTVTLSDDSRIDGNTPQNCGGPTPIPACAS